jgi:WS/DGAT/MGAT family acyltransferase
VKRAGKRLASTVNDVLLAAVAGALRRYLARHGAVPHALRLRAVVPVNLRSADDAATLGNRFGLVFLPLPVGLDTPLDRLGALKRHMDAIKRSAEAYVVYGLLRFVGATAATIEGAAVSLLGQKATAVMTNVPGPQEPLYLCGSRIEDLVFWVPQSGRLGLGVSIFSYTGRVRIGIAADRGLIADPETLIADYHAALDELLRAAAAAPAGET